MTATPNMSYFSYPGLVSRWENITPEMIIESVCTFHKISKTQLYSPSRRLPLVNARRQAMTIIRIKCETTLVAIGKLIGGRDHSSVINLLNTHKHCLKIPEYKKDYQDLMKFILTGDTQYKITAKEKPLTPFQILGFISIDEYIFIEHSQYWTYVDVIDAFERLNKDKKFKTTRIGDGNYKITRIK